MRKELHTGLIPTLLHYSSVKYVLRRKALIVSAFLVFVQLAMPLTTIVVYAAAISSNDVGSSASLDPVGNKASRLQMQGASGVEQSSGALTYSYPLTIPEGRGGMSPKLSLSYNSQNNDTGWFGYGWTMSIPYVDRTAKVGTDKMYTNPAFVSSLHGELVSNNGVAYEQKIDDGSYAKYTFSGNTWQMTDRDGTTYYFGNSYLSRVQDDGGSKIGRWYLTEVRDKFGNGILYNYTKDNGTIYPSTISYTEHALAHPLNLVTFNLENKSDQTISYKYGFRTTDTKRVSYIKVITSGKDNSYFTFNYATGSNGVRSLLQSVEEKHLSTNDDWTTLPKTSFEYENSSTTFSGTVSPSVGPYGSNSVIDTNNNGILDLYNTGDGYYPIDINGDYKKDLALSDVTYDSPANYGITVNFSYNVATSTTNFVLRQLSKPYSPYTSSLPLSLPAPPIRSLVNPGETSMVPRASIIDVNGDGFDDIVYNDPYGGSSVGINTTNNTFTYPSTSALSFNISSDQIADINGDGLQDKISKTYTATSTIFNVYLNNGSSYSTSTNFMYDAKIASTSFDIGVRFTDINNDGLVDVIRSYTSNYTSASGPACTTAYSNPPSPAPINQSANEIAINTGSSFALSSTTLSGYLVSYTNCSYGVTSGYLVTKTSKEYDTNGDLVTDYDGATNNTLKQDILKKVTTSLGSTMDVSYTWTTKTGLNPILPVPMYIVATTTDKLSVSDTTPHSVGYNFYEGQMYFDATAPRDHKFAGFGKVEVIDGKNKTMTYYHQGNGDEYTTGEKGDSYYNIGRAYRSDTFDLSSSTSTLVSKNLSLYTTYSYASSSFTYLDSQVSGVYNTNGSYMSSGSKNVYDEVKRLIKTSYNYGDIEPFISFASSTIIDKGTDLLTSSYEYSNTRPQRLVKQLTTDYAGKTLGDTTYYYDGLPRSLVDKGAVTSISNTVYNTDGTVNSTSTTQTAYDTTGNAIQTTDNLNHVTKAIFDSTYFFPTAKIDALGATTTLTYDPYTLNVLTSKGPDGITSVKETDGFGKVTRSYIINNSGGTSDEVKTSYVYGGGVSIFTRKLGDSGTSARSVQIYDSFGRLIQSKNETTADVFSTEDKTYDSNSNIISTSLPYTTNGYGLTTDTPANGATIYSYDGLGRVLTKSSFGTTLSYSYGARTLTVQDNASTQHKKSYVYDASGNISQVYEYNGGNTYTTNYNYTPLGKLSRITDSNGNIRNFSYLSSGSLAYQEDPHTSTDTTYTTYSYTYDSLGNLLTKGGTLGTTTYAYDSLNRPTSRTLSDGTYGTSSVSIVYTGCSNNYSSPCTINRTTSSTTLAYNVSGRISSETISIDGKSFARSYAYDTFGNPTTITYPDNGKTVYTYTLDGKQLTLSYITPSGSTKNIVTTSSYNSLGALSSLTYGNAIQMCNTYTTTSSDGVISPKLLKSAYLFNSTGCSSAANQIELYKDEFTYKDNLTPSNVLTTYKDIAGTSHTKSDTFTYDNLARLTQVSTSYDGGGAVVNALTYDPIGNILKENNVLYRYSLDGTQNVHAATSIGGANINYDAQGNRIQVGDNSYAWNALNQLVSATSTNGTEFYTYDENGERIKKIIKATSVINQKATPSTSSSSLGIFIQGDLLATVATSSTYIATSTYNSLSALSILDKTILTSLAGDYYGSPFTSKFCASATSTANRQSCVATTTKQLLANNINGRSTSTVATTGLIIDILNIVTGTYLIPTSYTGIATSSIATSATTTFIVDSATISSYNTFVATGVIVPMAEYANLPYVSTTTYASLTQVGLTDTSKVKALLTLASCTSLTTACATAKKVVFEKYYKENGYLLSDKALQEMWYVFAAKARLPGNSGEFTSTSTTLGSISVPVITSINTSVATSTYYSGKYFTTEYNTQNTSEPRLPYFNTTPYYINKTAFSELFQAGITQTTIDSYQALIADLLSIRTSSSTEYIAALKAMATYDKKVTLSATTTKELYLVVLGAASIPNNISDYSTNATFDLTSYLTMNSYQYNGYSGTWPFYSSACYAGYQSDGSSKFTRCVLTTSSFTLPVATSSTVSYILSASRAPQPIEWPIILGQSSKGTIQPPIDKNYSTTELATLFQQQYATTTPIDGSRVDADITSTVVARLAGSTTTVLIINSGEYAPSGSTVYPWVAASVSLKAFVNTPRLSLASTTLVEGVTSATSSSFTGALLSTISTYFGEISDSSDALVTASTTATSLMVISPESYAEFGSTTLRDAYAISKVFLSTSTSLCITDASTTECDKQLRKTAFREIVKNLSGFVPSQAATEEFWMVHKGLLALPNINYASTTATTTVPGYWTTVVTAPYMPSGGTITTSGEYVIHTFTSSSTFLFPVSTTTVEILAIGGGGGGSGGGGGAGQVVQNNSLSVGSSTYFVTIGASGSSTNFWSGIRGGAGGTTTIGSLVTAVGGAGGGNFGAVGGNGGSASGGGGGNNDPDYFIGGGTGTYAGGNKIASVNSPGGNAYPAGGGGGAGAVGSNASFATGGNGGAGVISSISGTSTYYGGGGGGTSYQGGTPGTGGQGGGGNGSYNSIGGAGSANTGSGGGGGGNGYVGGNGGTGLAVIRYLATSIPGATTTQVYISTSSAMLPTVLSSSTPSSLVFSRSSLPVSLSTTTVSYTSTSTVPGYWTYSTTTSTFPIGGTITTSGTSTIHTFTASSTFNVGTSTSIQILVVGGGGGGSGGGGGGGQVVSSSTVSVSSTTYVVTIGGGGVGTDLWSGNRGVTGQTTTFGSLISAIGGAGGGNFGATGANGGSAGGGGAGNYDPDNLVNGGTGTYGGGNKPASVNNSGAGTYPAGGGGGAGAVGTNATYTVGGNGGIGATSTITGTSAYYGGGGGGSSYQGGTVGTGGQGGGGNGSKTGTGGTGTANSGGGGGGGGNGYLGGNGGTGVLIIRYPTANFQAATTTGTYTASTTITSMVTHLELVPPGLLSDLQFNSLYSTSTFALATSTKVVSEDTYNELLRTPLRINTDIDTIFTYALPYATSTCPGDATTSSCVVTAQKSKVKDTISSLSGFALSDVALEELNKVRKNELSIVPISLANATMTQATQSVIVPLSTSEGLITFSTSTVASTTVLTTIGSCSFGTIGATTSACFIDLPYINSTINSLLLSYVVSTSSTATSTVLSTLTYVNSSSTSSTSTPTLVTTTATSSVTGQRTASTTYSFALSTLFQNFLTSSSSKLTLVPSVTSTTTSYFSITSPTLTITRTVLVPRISYTGSTSTMNVFSRASIPGYATTTATSTVDLTTSPTLDFSVTFLSPVGRIVSVGSASNATTSVYSGYVVDTTYAPLPVAPQYALPSVGYPYATSSLATSTINTLTVATTTTTTIYTPFSNYVDASSTVTTYLTLNGTLVGAYTYQKGNEAGTAKLTFAHTNYLGTPVLETDDKGDIVQMDITDVFGNYVMRDQRKDNAYHNKGYTSHEYDDVTGLTYSHARYLDTKMHSFNSVDPMLYKIPESYLTDPQQMNSYAYARNNPIVYTDPNGEFIQLPILFGLAIASFFAVKDFKETKNTLQNSQSTPTQKTVSGGLYASNFIGIGIAGQLGKQVGKQVAKSAESQIVKTNFSGLWSTSKTDVTPTANAIRHANDHASEFGLSSAISYVKETRNFISSAIERNLPAKMDGNVIRTYDANSNTFSAFNLSSSKGITPRTMFKPDPIKHGFENNLEYWKSQRGQDVNLRDLFINE